MTWITSHAALLTLILGAVISLLNGLMPFIPAEKKDELNWLGKTVLVLRWLLDLLSPTTAKDSPNTIKCPLTWSKAPAGSAPKMVAPGVKQKGFVRVEVVLMILGALTILGIFVSAAGCCYFGIGGRTCKKEVDQCVAPEIRKDMANVFDLVVDVLNNGTGNLDQELAVLQGMGEKSGAEVVWCVVQQYLGQQTAAASNRVTLTPAEMRGMVRARQWLQAHPGPK